MTQYDNCAVMVLTCDKNKDLLNIFFDLLLENWKEFDGNIYINSETPDFVYKNNKQIKNTNLTFNDSTPWSFRLKKQLCSIPEEYVLLLLDDFFLYDMVINDVVYDSFRIMKSDADIACFNFVRSPGPDGFIINEYFALKSKKAKFRVNLQAALWNKNTLIKFIRDHEGPWQFETWGNLRCKRYNDVIYGIRNNDQIIFPYFWGGAIADGKWRSAEVCYFLINKGYQIDFTKRGYYDISKHRSTEIKKRSFFKKAIDVIRSLIC